MFLKEVGNGYVTVQLDPGQCLLLAEACWHATDHYFDQETGPGIPATVSQLFLVLKCHFEALALLGDARAHVTKPRDMDEWNLPTVIAAWALTAAMKGKGAE